MHISEYDTSIESPYFAENGTEIVYKYVCTFCKVESNIQFIINKDKICKNCYEKVHRSRGEGNPGGDAGTNGEV